MCSTIQINMIATGHNISRMRKEKGITIKQIQEQMGFNTPQAIYKWQNGSTLPSLENLVVLAELFNIEKLGLIAMGIRPQGNIYMVLLLSSRL